MTLMINFALPSFTSQAERRKKFCCDANLYFHLKIPKDLLQNYITIFITSILKSLVILAI